MTVAKTGHCLCGAVRFEVELDSLEYAACHCGMCRRWTGGPFFAAVAREVMILEGEASVRAYKTSDWASRVHCAECGSKLWYRLDQGGFCAVSVGALDDQSDMVLAEEIYIDCKPAGYAFAGDLKKKTEAEVMAAFASSEPQ
jgi:hypothetical protein